MQRRGYQPTSRLVARLAGISTVPADAGDESQECGSKSGRNGGERIHKAERSVDSGMSSRYSGKKDEKECAEQLD